MNKKVTRKHSDGWYHEMNAIMTLVVIVIISCVCAWFWWGWTAIGLLLGGVFGLFIDPDLDHPDATRAEYRAKRIFGKVLGTIFQTYWTPYTIFGHRSVFTHGGFSPLGWMLMIFIATPIRMIYAFWWIGIVAIVKSTWIYWIPPSFWVALWVGWALQDFVHWLRDYTL